jgi:hypothetical protein
VQSSLWVSQPLWGAAESVGVGHTSVDGAFSSLPRSESTSLLPVLGGQTGSAHACVFSQPETGVAHQHQHQDQHQLGNGDGRHSGSRAECQISAMHASLLAKVTASRPIGLSTKHQATPYTPPLGTAALLARRATVAARLDARANEYRDAGARDGSARRFMPQQMAISDELERDVHSRKDTGLQLLVQFADPRDDAVEAFPAKVAAASPSSSRHAVLVLVGTAVQRSAVKCSSAHTASFCRQAALIMIDENERLTF